MYRGCSLVEVGRTGKGEHHQGSGSGSLETLLKLALWLGTARLEVFSAERSERQTALLDSVGNTVSRSMTDDIVVCIVSVNP